MTVDLYGPAGNYAVMKLPNRQNYGVLFQADSLEILVSDLREALSALDSGDADEARDGLAGIFERLGEIQSLAADEFRRAQPAT